MAEDKTQPILDTFTPNKQSPTLGKTIISVKGVKKSFSSRSGTVEILSDINFSIPERSLTILFGPSGSGKTTLLNILSTLEPPTEGTVEIANQDVYTLNADQRSLFRAQNMGIVHQENYWIKSLNVIENVAMPIYLTGSKKEPALQVAKESLAKVGMSEYANHSPTVLSGGQQQRVSMARALVATPQIILADEPTGNLDSKNGKAIMDLLLYFQRNLGRTIVLVTHNIEYLPLSDMQLYILDGKLTEAKPGKKMPPDIINSLKTQISELTKMEQR